MRWMTWLLAGLVLAGACASAEEARAAGYATDDVGRLYRILPDEKKTELIGTVGVEEKRGTKTVTTTPSLTDLAQSDLHGLYGITFTHLYKIDMRDPGKSKQIGRLTTGFGQFNALAFDDKGRLFALEYGDLYQVDLKTGKATVLGSLGGGFASDGDLAFIGPALYASVNKGLRCHLVRIDLKTWKATDVGVFREAPLKGAKAKPKQAPKRKEAEAPYRPRTYDDVWGLIWDGRSLFALTPQGEVLEVDWRTALVKPVYRVKATYYGACPMLRI